MTPSLLSVPTFLMCPPFSLSTRVANNIWMTEYSEQERAIDRRRAVQQFLTLCQFLAAEGLVYLLPAPADCGLQDLTFTANLAFVPEHLRETGLVLVSNFTSPPRVGEAEVGWQFFESVGYRPVRVPFRFEGEAEIKHLHGNVYIGGYGLRSERRTYDWMEEKFDMKVIKVEETDPYLYHLDCSVFPVDSRNTMVCTEIFRKEEIAEIEKHTNILSVSLDHCYNGICNSVRLGNLILNASNINDLRAGTEDYDLELAKNRALEDIAARHVCEPVFFNLSEFLKSGALLSCLVMHLNRHSYHVRVL